MSAYYQSHSTVQTFKVLSNFDISLSQKSILQKYTPNSWYSYLNGCINRTT